MIGQRTGIRHQDTNLNINAGQISGQAGIGFGRRFYQGQALRTQAGRVEDPEFLDRLTE